MDINEYIQRNFLYKSDQQMGDALGITPKAVRERRRRMGLRKDGPEAANSRASSSSNETGIQVLERLLSQNNIDISEVGSVRISNWQQAHKNVEGEAEIVDLAGAAVTLKVDPTWNEGPAWPVVQPAAPVKVNPVKTRKPDTGDWKTAVILPDAQVGYRRFQNGKKTHFDPFHDETAMDVALQITKDLRPDLIINLGDLVDFAPFGTYEQEAAFVDTVQPTLDRAHRFLAEQRAVAPEADIRYIAGNHDARLQKSIIRNALSAFGLRRANEPESWPVLSLQNLLRLEDLDIEYVDAYPAGVTWINERLACVHGRIVRSNGSTAKAVVDDARASVIFGHVHRIEVAYKTRYTFHGPKINLSATPGCLCRIDGSVPSTKSAIDAKGKPSTNMAEQWQQGLGVVTYLPGDGEFSYEQVFINEGSALFRGNMYESTVDMYGDA